MDTQQIRIMLPNDALARHVEQRLAGHARTEREPAQTLDLGIITLLVTIAGTLATAVTALAQAEASRAQVEATRMETLKTMLEIKQQLEQQGQADKARIGASSGALRTFAEANEAFLRQLLGLPAE